MWQPKASPWPFCQGLTEVTQLWGWHGTAALLGKTFSRDFMFVGPLGRIILYSSWWENLPYILNPEVNTRQGSEQ